MAPPHDDPHRVTPPNAFRSSDHDPLLVGLELRPTLADAIALTRRLVTREGVAHALVAKLEAGALEAYRNQLEAQTGKTITPERAALLARISTQLPED